FRVVSRFAALWQRAAFGLRHGHRTRGRLDRLPRTRPRDHPVPTHALPAGPVKRFWILDFGFQISDFGLACPLCLLPTVLPQPLAPSTQPLLILPHLRPTFCLLCFQ